MPNKDDQIAIEMRVTGAEQAAAGVDRVAEAEARVEKETADAGRASQRATQSHSKRTDAYRALDQRLRTLLTAEDRHQQALAAGAEATEEERRASARRESQIQRISRAMASAEDRQHRVNEAMRAGINEHRVAGVATEQTEGKTRNLRSELNLLQGRLGGVAAGFGSMAGAMTAGGGIALIMQGIAEATEAVNERLEENIRLTNEAAKATLNLHALNLTFDQGSEDLVTSFSNASGRDFTEVANLLTQFRSATAALPREEQDKLFIEGLLPLALGNSGSIDPIAKFIGRISPITSDPTEIKNIIGLGVNLAGEADPAQFLGNAGELLVPGRDAGLQPAETLALLAFGSSKVETSVARTQLRNILARFSADADTRGKLGALGVPEDADFFQQLQALSQTDFGTEQAVDLVGIENATVLSSLVNDFDTAQSFRDQTVAAAGEGDLFDAFLTDLHERSPRHRQALELAQLEQVNRNARRNDTDAQTIARARGVVELQLERAVQAGTIPASAKKARLATFDRLAGSVDFRRHVRGDLFAGNIAAAPGQDTSGSISDFDLSDLTAAQIAESAAASVEFNGLGTDLIPGGDVSTTVEISDFVRDTLNRQGSNNVLNINGTYIQNAADPRDGDLAIDREVP